ncbi:Iron-regulated protein A precursor [Aliarcobacter thereius]|uniref:Imelysin n=2 Tax=Aliarcobacter thereius TaxID=544718 RepID=A0A1C0B2L6_9BACT|nr:imelysin family protein [Aliarcobacter thereius]OCL85372.1 Iron-regulated protein A precursor [Aliarcobacter thereius]OCL89648.1 Iron-regulated protein A precursor [Aliarcobacter thereius]OCL95580.1 Imelysin [Aliarcobacter thereius LMG 24486]OCL96526.1 Iron-regulated protein A precursor [Aliarcobacter thereius]QBF16435.1 imelysin-like iron-regulated protein A-like protein, IrpA family [Aliarcobacter thereius LMG 24486]
MKFGKKLSLLLIIMLSITFSSCANKSTKSKQEKIVENYAKIAQENYKDALEDAKKLQIAINNFVENPTQESYDNAKLAWLESRESYGTTEAFRLSNGPIDSEEEWIEEAYGALEGQINAWPLDENMIDYIIDADGKRTSGNIIDTVGKFNPGGEDSEEVDVTEITKEALTALNENGGEANVSTGYHAIEFLLWGQDQDYENFLEDKISKGAMNAGQRPLSDFTSDKDSKRRLQYLKVVTEKLVEDLETVYSAWEEKIDGNRGLYKAVLLNESKETEKNIDTQTALKQIISGMGIFIKSELANERIAVAVLTPSEEDEHSCFSDNTHRDLVKNYEGFKNILTSTYKGKKYGDSLFDTLEEEDKQRIIKLMSSIEEKIEQVDRVAKTEAHFDHQIRPEHYMSKVLVKLKNELRKLGNEMVTVAKANNISLTDEDVTDPEETKL